ncbi:hypothetical protein GCM10028805_15450 [Spirosoma harenae]
MSTSTISLNTIADFLQKELAVEQFPETEQGGIYYPSTRPIHRIGLALEPFSTLTSWIRDEQLDAVWIHRPWQLDLTQLPSDIGILSHHLPFDEGLTVGYNPKLAKQLGAIQAPEPIGYKQDINRDGKPSSQRPLGMIFDVSPQEFDQCLVTVRNLFNGYDRAEAGHSSGGWQPTSSRIAVVGAMTNALVREAAERGAHLYLTGAYRKPGQQAVDETGIAVISVGHRRCEEYGLRILANLLEKQFPIECAVREPMLILA